MTTSVIEKKKAFTKTQCKRIYVEAYEAGLAAGKDADTPKFVVGSPTTPLGSDIDFKKKTYILDGLCGFAWVNISPARGAFVNWLKSHNKIPLKKNLMLSMNSSLLNQMYTNHHYLNYHHILQSSLAY